jgi:tyrosyl-tRNA synthetase
VKTEGGAEETEVEAQADGSVTGSGAQEVSVGKSSEEALEKLTLAAEGVNASSS